MLAAQHDEPVELVWLFNHAGGGRPRRLIRCLRALGTLGAEVAFTAVTLPSLDSRRDEPRPCRRRYLLACAERSGLDGCCACPTSCWSTAWRVLAYLLAHQRISLCLRAPEAVIFASLPRPRTYPSRLALHLLGDYELSIRMLAR